VIVAIGGEEVPVFERLEEMADGDLRAIVFALGLKEIVAEFGRAHATFDTEFEVVEIAGFGTEMIGNQRVGSTRRAV